MSQPPIQPSFKDAATGYPGRAFAICLIAYSFSTTDLALFSYAVPSIREEFDLTRNEMGWVAFVSFAVGGLLLSGIGNLTDRFGRKSMMVGTTIVSSIFVALHAVVPNVYLLTLFRTLAFACGGALYPVTGALMSEEAPARYRGIFSGMLQTGYPIGWFLASIFAATIVTNFGWRALFLVGLLSIPYVFVIIKFLRETKRFSDQKTSGITEPKAKISDLFEPGIRKRSLLLFFAQLTFVIAYSSAFWFPTYFAEERGLDIGLASYLVGIGNGIAVFGYLLAAYVGEFIFTRRTTLVIWTLLGAFNFLILIWFTTDFWSALIAFSLMSIFFYGTAAVKFAYVAEIFPTRLRATGLAVCGSLAVSIGQAVGPMIMAQVSTVYGWNIAMTCVVAIPLFVASFMYLFLDPVPSGLEVEELQARLNEKQNRTT